MGRRGRRLLLGLLAAVLVGAGALYLLVWRPVAPAYAFLHALDAPLPTEADLERVGGIRYPREGPPRLLRYLPPPGDGRAPILVVVAGVTALGIDDPRVWRLLLALREAGFAVLAPEVPGLSRLGEDRDGVKHVRDALVMASKAEGFETGLPGADASRIGVVGVSLGASLALHAAATSPVPVRALVLVGAPDDPRNLAPSWFREPVAPEGATGHAKLRSGSGLFARHGVLRAAAGRIVGAAEAAALRAWIDGIGEAPASGGPPPPEVGGAESARWVRAALAEERIETSDLAWVLTAAEPDLAICAPAAFDADLPGLRSPVWLVHGTEDPLVPPSEMDLLAARLSPRVPVRTLASALLTHVDVGSPGLAEAWRHLRVLTEAFDAVRGEGS
jgi:pimeloyl-ACP methyl ester carboxylesterase